MIKILTALLPALIFSQASAAPPKDGLIPAVYTVSQQNTNFNELSRRCAAGVHHNTMQAIVRTESSFNPYAIGVVKGALKQQPRSLSEAVPAVKMLRAQGRNFSMGLAQVNMKNMGWLGLTDESIFDPCTNLAAGAKVLEGCFAGAKKTGGTPQEQLQKAFSCYYSGNYRFGFTKDFPGQPSYVQKVVSNAAYNSETASIKVPAVNAAAPVIAPAKKPRKSSAAVATATVATPQPETQETERPRAAWDVFAEF